MSALKLESPAARLITLPLSAASLVLDTVSTVFTSASACMLSLPADVRDVASVTVGLEDSEPALLPVTFFVLLYFKTPTLRTMNFSMRMESAPEVDARLISASS